MKQQGDLDGGVGFPFHRYPCMGCISPLLIGWRIREQLISACDILRANIKFIINSQSIAAMLKFKEIKKSIIRPSEHDASPILLSKKCYEPSQISFKTIKQYQECSPFARKQLNEGFHPRFDTQKKAATPSLSEFNIKSESKENNPKNIYYNRASNFENTENKRLEFGHKKRKVNNAPSEYYEKSYENSASKNNNLSFANLLQSKRADGNSKNKTYLESDRMTERESSISKLKEKLFGMKKVISEKPKDLHPNRCETDRIAFQGQRNIFKGCRIDLSEEDLVKISIKKQEGSIQELDMAPYF